MSEQDPGQELAIPTLETVNAFASSEYTDDSGSLLGANPEMMETFIESSLGILSQLNGQPKVDYFHSIFFMNRQDQEYVWEKMAEHDDEAKEWLASLQEQEQAKRDAAKAERQEAEELHAQLVQTCLGRIATHPNVECTADEFEDHIKTVYFSSSLAGEDVHFRLDERPPSQYSSNEESRSINIRVARQSTTPFDAQEAENKTDRAQIENRMVSSSEVSHFHRLAKEGKQLATVGHIFSDLHENRSSRYIYPYPVIDSAQAEPASFLRSSRKALEVDTTNRRPIPFKIESHLEKKRWLDNKEVAQLIEMVENGEPLTGDQAIAKTHWSERSQ